MSKESVDLFVFAGEVSGDLHAEKLLQALLQKRPSLKIYGVAGPRMRALGMKTLMPMEEFQVMGFIDVFFSFLKILKNFYKVRRAILSCNPKAVLFVDYPGFNLRMAKRLRNKGYQGKLIHYICPTVWAWGKKRIPRMVDTLDLLLTLFPFEVDCFAKTRLTTKYVGHPLVARIDTHTYAPLDLPQGKKIVSLFPGSRTKEINRNAWMQFSAAKKLLEKDPSLFFPISLAQEKFRPSLEKMIRKCHLEEHTCFVPPGRSYDLMKQSHLAIAKSGTVTLELALHQVPTVVTYGISTLDLWIARDLLKILLPHYCIVNIVYKDTVFPELYGPNLTEEKLLYHAKELLTSPSLYEECQKKCRRVKELLENKDASHEASKLILETIF